MNIPETIASILRENDGLVDIQTITRYQTLYANHNINDPSVLSMILECFKLNGDAAKGDPSKSWLSRPDIFRSVKDEFEKEAAKKTKKTPLKAAAATQPLMKMEVQSFGDVQYNFSASKSSLSQDSIFGKTKEATENFGKAEIFRNRNQLPRIEIKESDKNLKKMTDFINEPFNVRRQAIAHRTKVMTEFFLQHFEKHNIENFTRLNFVDDFISKDLNIFCLGRIVPGPTNDTLMENNICFECYDPERDTSKMCTLELKAANQIQFDKDQMITTPECLFFANQIVVIEGSYCRETNTFDVRNIYQETYSAEDHLTQKVCEANFFDDGKYISIMAVGGPYTTSNTFDFAPLEEFLKKVVETKPNVVFFFGPFLDQNNEAVKSGELVYNGRYLEYGQTFELMLDIIAERLKELPNINIMIVPSLNDAHHFYPYPQVPLESRREKDPRFKLLSNPSQVRLNNDLRVGMTSADFLFDVIKNSYVKSNATNKFALCLKECLNQRMFYPIYPCTVPMDTKNYSNLEFDGIPDLLFYQSSLPSGIKVVKNTILVNYASLMKAKDSGSYTTIMIANQLDKPMEERVHIKVFKL